MATIVTRSGKGSPLTNNEVDANFTNLNTDKAELSGATFTGEIVANAGIALGDNDKATFGAGDDLQIYHDGFNTNIKESGAGSLLIDATNTYFRNAAGTKDYAWMVDGGAVSLFHNNSPKLATTSTGINVTGVITTDGMTTSADINFGDDDKALFGASNDLKIYHASNNQSYIHEVGSGDLNILATNLKLQDEGGSTKVLVNSTGINVTGTATMDGLTVQDIGNTSAKFERSSTQFIEISGSAGGQAILSNANDAVNKSLIVGTVDSNAFALRTDDKNRVLIDSNGDISFYEDTGTTPKLFWDASAESLGIGTSSPSVALQVESSTAQSGRSLRLAYDGSYYTEIAGKASGGVSYNAVNATAGGHRFEIDGSEKMRLDYAGRVGIGTSSPTNSITTTGALEFTGNAFNGSGTGIWSPSTNELGFVTAGSTRLRIDSSGRVGIGTSSPDTQLHVFKSSVSGTSYDSNDLLTLENNGFTAINMISSASTASTLIFSDTTRAVGYLQYNHSDNSLRTNVNGSERMRIDSSGNLLVGTTSANQLGITLRGDSDYIYVARNEGITSYFDRKSTDGAITEFRKDGTTVGSIGTVFGSLTAGTGATGLRFTDGDTSIRPWNLTTNAVIDNTINLGAPAGGFKDLYLSGTANAGIVSLKDGNNNGQINATTSGAKLYYNVHDAHIWQRQGSEKARIDSSGNLLVGQTSQSPNTVGVSLNSNGNISAKRDGGIVGLFNRGTSDGTIVDFRKDGTTVGSIFSKDGAYSGIGNGDVGLLFLGAANDIRPWNPQTNLAADNAIDLGHSDTRFKDLYLSGGVYLGGTGAANKLDDYEEGTFVVTTAGDASGAFNGTPTCYYTKIGNTVNVLIAFRVGTNFTSQSIGGLPFSVNHTGMSSSFICGGVSLTSSDNEISTTLGNGSTTLRFHNNQNTGDSHLPNTTNEYYRLNFTYRTTA